MRWYEDRSALSWRVVKIAQEMLMTSMRRDDERSRHRAAQISVGRQR